MLLRTRNHGRGRFVNKIFFIFVFIFVFSFLFGLEPAELSPSGWVNDYASVMEPGAEAKLSSLIGELEEKTSAEITVVTLKSLEGNNIDDFTNRLFEQWGTGKKEKDNGVMVLVSLNDRKARIETGYGIEPLVPDAMAGRIIRQAMTPYFKEGDYSGGIISGVLNIAAIIASDAGAELTGNYAPERKQAEGRGKRSIFGLIFFLLMIPVFIRHPWMLLFFMGGGGGRGFGGGGFGGGGFGGGLSGGGGASGGW